MLISDHYRKMNESLHHTHPTFGRSGQKWKGYVMDLCHIYKTSDVLDYGCGKSTLQAELPFRINQYDPAITEHSKEPDPADIVVCTDVLEHIEPECIDAVIDDISEKMKLAGLLTVATRPAKKKLADGRNAHLIIENADWWREKIKDKFKIILEDENVTEDGEVVFVVEAKDE